MQDGTYAIRTYLSKTNYEKNTMVLAVKDGQVTGYIKEIAYRPVPFSGPVEGESFSIQLPPFITIVGDLSMKIKGKWEGDTISGSLSLLGLELPFFGERVGEAVFPELKIQ